METTPSPKTGLKSWTTRDIMILAAMVVTLAVVSAISSYLRTVLEAAFGPVGNRLVMVINIFVLFVPPYLLRKPLSAIMASFLIGLVSLPFSPFGLVSLVGYLVGGAITEVIFAAGRYRNYSLRFLIIGGVVYNAISLVFIWIPMQISSLNMVGIVSVLIATLVGGIVGGWLTKVVGDAVLKSGVISNQVNIGEDNEELDNP